ncbi:MAG: ATP-binding protein [Leptolyngbyaceae cyanobacterium]
MHATGESVDSDCKILIIDDSEADRLTYRRYLSRAEMSDCTILESDCGEVGLEMFLQHHPNVVLLDYLLPDIDGLEFLQVLSTKIQPLPAVIMLTGQGSEQVAVEAMKMGAQDYLVKSQLASERLTQAVRLALLQQRLRQRIARQQQQQRLMARVALRISQSRDLATILDTTVKGTRQLLNCDRTLVYRFESDMSGTVLAESVTAGWTQSLGAAIQDTCFQDQGAERYLKGHKTVIANIYDSSLTPCHVRLLERFQVKANIVVPILLREAVTLEHPKLWGLFIAHHCRGFRQWQESELALLDDLSVQLAIAIQQSELISTLEERATTLTAVNHLLVETTEALEIRNRELDEFAFVASHDLKSPLRAIANLANWLEEDLQGNISDENQRQLDLLQGRVRRMEGFIDGLLRYSRAGRQSILPEKVDTHALVTEIAALLVIPSQFRITLSNTLPTIHTQKLLLQQVLDNLIGNAVKYHDRPDGEVRIHAIDQDDMIEFAITDDGPGIAPEFHQRIFDVFQTLNSRDTIESTGIGLSIVKKLVSQQGGTITVRSAMEEGSTFVFTWPKKSA